MTYPSGLNLTWQDGAEPSLSAANLQPLTNAAKAGIDRDRGAQWAANPDALIVGTITRDASGAATSAGVVWPDGTPGTYTALVVSTAFPGAVDSYSITYGSPVTRTWTQPTVTRNASGAVTARPALVAS